MCQRQEESKVHNKSGGVEGGLERGEPFMDDGWEVGRVADCQMFPLSFLRFWYGDRGKVEWGEEMRGKDGERWLNEGRRYDRGELPGRISESRLFFLDGDWEELWENESSFLPPGLVPACFLCPRQHPICWCPHLFGPLHWLILTLILAFSTWRETVSLILTEWTMNMPFVSLRTVSKLKAPF